MSAPYEAYLKEILIDEDAIKARLIALGKQISEEEIFELENLIKNLKNTAKPILFDTPSFKARVNILHNESLRLSDMINIPSIFYFISF